MENYLHCMDPVYIHNLIKLRTRTHQLPVTKNRFNSNNVDVSCNLCCCGDVGDEFHYLFKCTYFNDMRTIYLPDNYHFIEHNCHELFQNNETTLTNLARFFKKIMAHFKQKSNNLAPRKVRKTRIGRMIKPPDKLDL